LEWVVEVVWKAAGGASGYGAVEAVTPSRYIVLQRTLRDRKSPSHLTRSRHFRTYWISYLSGAIRHHGRGVDPVEYRCRKRSPVRPDSDRRRVFPLPGRLHCWRHYFGSLWV